MTHCPYQIPPMTTVPVPRELRQEARETRATAAQGSEASANDGICRKEPFISQFWLLPLSETSLITGMGYAKATGTQGTRRGVGTLPPRSQEARSSSVPRWEVGRGPARRGTLSAAPPGHGHVEDQAAGERDLCSRQAPGRRGLSTAPVHSLTLTWYLTMCGHKTHTVMSPRAPGGGERRDCTP